MNALSQYLALSRRAIVNTIRQPAAIFPAIFFPLMFLTMTSAALNRATTLPGFPEVDSFVQFVVTTTIVQGALFGAIVAGTDMARDIEGGFFERLIASPVARTSIMVGRVMGAALMGFFQAWLYFTVTSIFGLRVEGGILGMLAISLVAATVSAGIGAISVSFALRTGSAEAVQGAFPMLFAMLFLSSAFFPRNLMNGWFKTAATINPLSHMIEGLRHIVIVGFDLGNYLTALGIAAGILAFGVTLSSLALRGRLIRA
jgi:ABC-2 type transport system permease protein